LILHYSFEIKDFQAVSVSINCPAGNEFLKITSLMESFLRQKPIPLLWKR